MILARVLVLVLGYCLSYECFFVIIFLGSSRV